MNLGTINKKLAIKIEIKSIKSKNMKNQEREEFIETNIAAIIKALKKEINKIPKKDFFINFNWSP